jgi:hypothetical protein
VSDDERRALNLLGQSDPARRRLARTASATRTPATSTRDEPIVAPRDGERATRRSSTTPGFGDGGLSASGGVAGGA